MNHAARFLFRFLAWGVALYAIVLYGFFPLGTGLHPDMRDSFLQYRTVVYLHAFAASLALLLGPLQFWPGLRAARPRLHRWSGRVYLLVGVGLGGVSGFWMALHAFGGPLARFGFATLAAAWLLTGALALRAILAGDVAAHRAWMVRNMALSFAAVTLRLYVPLSFAAGLPFELAYAVIAWLCWVPNLVVAEMALARGNAPALRFS